MLAETIAVNGVVGVLVVVALILLIAVLIRKF